MSKVENNSNPQLIEGWWDRQSRLYGSDQSKWWAHMPIHERVEMVADIIKSGAIPLYTAVGANTLYLRGAPIHEVIDCIIILLLNDKDPQILKWFEDLQSSYSSRLLVLELGWRGWLKTLSVI